LSVLGYGYLYSIRIFMFFSSSQYSFYTCRYLHILIYILPSPTIRPRTFYRSGWLRCDVFNSWEWYRFQFEFMFWPRTFYRSGWLRCYILYIILYLILLYIYYYYIIILYILYPIPSSSSSSDPSLIHSILVGTYIYLFIFLHSNHS
jgi:hypothetical protein